MNTPRIQSDDRGFTVSKSLAWTIVSGLVLAGVWIGNEVTGANSAIKAISNTLDQRYEETADFRRDTDVRVRSLESFKASSDTENGSLRRDLNSLRSDLRELNGLLRRLEGNLRVPQ